VFGFALQETIRIVANIGTGIVNPVEGGGCIALSFPAPTTPVYQLDVGEDGAVEG